MKTQPLRVGIEFIFTMVLLLFFTEYGQSHHVIGALSGAWQFIIHTMHGELIKRNFRGIMLMPFWSTVRLVLIAMCFSVTMGLLLGISSEKLRGKLTKTVHESMSVLLESIPEPLYLILIVIVVFFCLSHLNFNIPGLFPLYTPTLQDTIIPAIALSLPSAIYLQRILSIRLSDERNAPYVMTATAKGASSTRIFYRHIIPNILPTLIRQMPVVAGLIISSTFFVEFFMGYRGVLYYLTSFVGWNMISGKMQTPYESGATFLTLSFLALMWWAINVNSTTLIKSFRGYNSPSVPTYLKRRINLYWLIGGISLLSALIVISIFPKMVTNQSPTKEHLLNLKTFTPAPFPPSNVHQLGTDEFGRDLLSRTLHGTLPSLVPAIGTAIVIVIIAGLIAYLIFLSEKQWLYTLLHAIGRITTALPAVVIIFLVLYQRNLNSPSQPIEYFCWIIAIEFGRIAISFLGAFNEWKNFNFIEGTTAIGQTRGHVLITGLRSWLTNFTIEIWFSEFARVISIMTTLAMFHIYQSAKLESVPTLNGSSRWELQSTQITWFSMLGDVANQASYVLSYPYLIYGPVLAILITLVSFGMISRGLRGEPESF